LYLLLSLVFLLFGFSFVAHLEFARELLGFLFAVTPLAGVYAVSDDRRQMVVATILGAPALLSIIGHFYLDLRLVGDTQYLSLIVVYYGFTTYAVIRHLFRKKVVDTDTILSAASAYLMIGLTFAVTYMLIETVHTGSFVVNNPSGQVWEELFYFSIVTLTTLGYGDIVPVTPHARSVATLEATTGVLYMAVLLARLVSEYSRELPKTDRD
jgi:hypothetical protein